MGKMGLKNRGKGCNVSRLRENVPRRVRSAASRGRTDLPKFSNREKKKRGRSDAEVRTNFASM